MSSVERVSDVHSWLHGFNTYAHGGILLLPLSVMVPPTAVKSQMNDMYNGIGIVSSPCTTFACGSHMDAPRPKIYALFSPDFQPSLGIRLTPSALLLYRLPLLLAAPLPPLPAPSLPPLLCTRKMHGLAIRRNTIQCMQAILEATVVLGIQLEEEAAEAAARVMMIDESTELSPDVVQVI